MLHPSRMSVTAADVPAAMSPSNSPFTASIHMSEYCDEHAAGYNNSSSPASRTKRSRSPPGVRVTSCTTNSSRSVWPPLTGLHSHETSCSMTERSRLRSGSHKPLLLPDPIRCDLSWRAAVHAAVGTETVSFDRDESLPLTDAVVGRRFTTHR